MGRRLLRHLARAIVITALLHPVAGGAPRLRAQSHTVPVGAPAKEAGPSATDSVHALEVGGAYTGEYFYNVDGGVRTGGAHLHNLELSGALDASAFTGLAGFAGYVALLANFGGSVGELAGDAQGVSNIEAPDALRLYEAWVEKSWNRGSLLLGLYDLNRDFYVAEAAAVFINSSQGIGPEIASSGRNGPSIFPVTSLGARLELALTGQAYGRLAILDGVPGHPEDESRFVHLDLDREDGVLAIIETGIDGLNAGTRPFKLAAGGWMYTAHFDDPHRPGLSHDGAFGAYLIGEAQLSAAHSSRRLAAFGRVGYADEKVHLMNSGWGAGLASTGFIRARPTDELGLAVAGAAPSERLLTGASDAPDHTSSRAEWVIELTYRATAGPSFRVQPDLQYIVHPGMASALASCLLLGLRVDLTF